MLTPWRTHAHGLMQAREHSDKSSMHKLRTKMLRAYMRAHMLAHMRAHMRAHKRHSDLLPGKTQNASPRLVRWGPAGVQIRTHITYHRSLLTPATPLACPF